MSYSKLSHADLILACLKNDPEAWKEFRIRYHHIISLAIFRTSCRCGDASKGRVEDLIQDTYFKLCLDNFKLLRNFEFRTEAGLYGFFKVVATRVAIDHFRRPGSPPGNSEDVYTTDPPDQDAAEVIERNILIKEVEEVLFKVTGPGSQGERDRTIFWLYYRQGFTAGQIAELVPSLTTKGVESAIHRLTTEVRKRLTDEDADDPGDAA